MKICVVIPVLNEEKTIAQLVRGIKQKGLDVVVIDDGSADRSGALAKEQGAVVLSHDKRHGKGFSLRQGFQYALKEGYEGVVVMDGDGQHLVEDMDKFLHLAKEHPVSIIAGNRMSDAQSMPFVRFLTNRFMSWLISLSVKQNISDTQCGYRYIHRDILDAVKPSSEAYEIETEILMKAAKFGFKIYSVDIKTVYGEEKSKINPLRDTVRFFKYFFKENFSKQKNHIYE